MSNSRNYYFGGRSLSFILSTKKQTQELCHKALSIANSRSAVTPDFSIISGLRTQKEQRALYEKGRDSWNKVIYPQLVVTNNDGKFNKSSHQSGLAIDFVPIGDDGSPCWNEDLFHLVATCFFEAAVEMEIKIKWGGNFKSFFDGGHIEIIE